MSHDRFAEWCDLDKSEAVVSSPRLGLCQDRMKSQVDRESLWVWEKHVTPCWLLTPVYWCGERGRVEIHDHRGQSTFYHSERVFDVRVHEPNRRKGRKGRKRRNSPQLVVHSSVLTSLLVSVLLSSFEITANQSCVDQYPLIFLHHPPSSTAWPHAHFLIRSYFQQSRLSVMRLPIQPSTHQSIHPPTITVANHFDGHPYMHQSPIDLDNWSSIWPIIANLVHSLGPC